MSRAARKVSADATYPVPIGDLTDHQLLLLILDRMERQATTMTELQQAVSDLGSAVSGITARLADLLQQATDKATALQDQVDNLEAVDEQDKAALADATQQLQDLVSEASDAAAQVEQHAATLNSLAPEPSPSPTPAPGPAPTPDPGT